MDTGRDVAGFIVRILPTLFRISLFTGAIFPIGLYIFESMTHIIVPTFLYAIAWLITAYIFFKNSYRWIKNYFS